MEIFNHDSNIHFLGMRKYTITIAILLMIASIVLLIVKPLNYGLDFTGGVSMTVDYQQSVEIADVRAALENGGLDGAMVQSLGGTREVSIRMQTKDVPSAADADGKINLDRVAATVTKVLQAARPDAKLKNPEFISAEVGAELRSDGTVAAVFVILGIMAYLWIRFERRFAIAAVATEVHDVLVTLGILAVVFDRIRELFRLARKAEPEEILNRSINNTLSRTIITSLFTGITMGALYFFGGTAVHGFAITMLIGIVVGTLSSIFVASPILLWLGVSKKDLMPVTKENPELARRP